ncbi:MAG: SMP-30/gluconolactonase/LRE family protein [Geminicoccaceae bacterium]|nr:SMP-30/gluconolactonase/LRE family protein [Geminicoccaceae bacterium]
MDIHCVVDSHSKTGEGAVWDEQDGLLYWVDIPDGLVHRYDPRTGTNRTTSAGEPVGCLAVRRQGGLVLATKSGFHLFDADTGERTPICDPEADRPHNRFNDGATDGQGRFWAGTMKNSGPPEPAGRFYRLDGDFHCMPWKDGIFTTNGLTFSPDGRTMYHSDSNPHVRTIWACDYDIDDGMPSNERVFFDTRVVAGRPDGGTVDADGCYWMAGVGGWQLVRITPDGAIDRIVEMPIERPTKPMFGGADMKTLFVTSIGQNLSAGSESRQPQAGGLFAIEGLGVQGFPQTRFAG